jgi:hypothetical protein
MGAAENKGVVMELVSLLRPLGVVAGPAAVLALVLLVGGLVTAGEDGLEASPLATASSALLLVALLGLGAAAVSALARLRVADRGVAGAAIAVVGTVLVAGGGWAALFVLPALAEQAPELLDSGLESVVVGYIASYVVFTVGWVWTGVTLIRARLVPTWLGVLVAVGGALAFVPAPEAFRLLVVSVAASLLARRLAVPEPTARTAQLV